MPAGQTAGKNKSDVGAGRECCRGSPAGLRVKPDSPDLPVKNQKVKPFFEFLFLLDDHYFFSIAGRLGCPAAAGSVRAKKERRGVEKKTGADYFSGS